MSCIAYSTNLIFFAGNCVPFTRGHVHHIISITITFSLHSLPLCGWMDCVTMISITFYATREEITIDTSDKNWANHSRATYTSPFLTPPSIPNTHRRRRSQSKQIAADGLNIDAISINTNAELDRTGNGQQKMGNFISAFSVLHPPSLVAVNSIFAVGLVYSILDGANRFYWSPTSQSNQQT